MVVSPLNFLAVYQYKGFNIDYSHLHEVGQGGPEVGNLSINTTPLEGYFGGPLIFFENLILVPKLKKSFFGKKFIIAKINLNDLSVNEIGPKRNLILLTKIEKGSIYFYIDLNNQNLLSEMI